MTVSIKFNRERPVLTHDQYTLSGWLPTWTKTIVHFVTPDGISWFMLSKCIHQVDLYLAIKRCRVQPASVHSAPNQSQQTHQPVCFIPSCHVKSSDSDVVPDAPQEVPLSLAQGLIQKKLSQNPLECLNMNRNMQEYVFSYYFFKLLIRVELCKPVSWVDMWI